MKSHRILSLAALAILCLFSCKPSKPADNAAIIIENDLVKLTVAGDATATSLVLKQTGEELLQQDKKIPLCTITQERPYQNEIKLAFPTKETTFRANSIRKHGDSLIIGFELIPWEAVIRLRITPAYIGFTIEDFRLTVKDYGISMDEPAISEMWFLRLPVKNRTRYGDWLNVIWDDRTAVCVLATDPYAKIDAEAEEGSRILEAGVEEKVKLRGAGAALVACNPGQLLDNIAKIETDFNLPHGADSRRNELYSASYYWAYDVNPHNLEEHLKFATMAGFRAFMIYYPSFTEGWDYRKLGDYDWRRSEFPGGKEDLARMLNRIRKAGMEPGFHFLHSHIGRDSRYITPVPDHRLNLLKTFTLAAPLSKTDSSIFVEENPAGITMTADRRVLRIGTELISYRNYTTSRPYKFTGCTRGIDETTVNSQPAGYIFGLLDVSEFGATSVYINQNTDLQEEVADKLANIYSAGFRFAYFDGSEGVNPPFWFNVSYAQWKVFSRFKPEPLFAEGAAKTHFSWHMLSRGNAFDIFKPEYLKEAVRKFPAEEAPRMMENFTHINFGWLGYWLPDSTTIGTQPDQLEYVTSRAAAWDCPVSLQANLALFAKHPRTKDNMEVLRRWEAVRARHWLTGEQKMLLRNLEQEHILLLNEKGEFELRPYTRIKDPAGGRKEIIAYSFSRDKENYVVYWHNSGAGRLELPVKQDDLTLLGEIGKKLPAESSPDGNVIIPAGERRYVMSTTLSEKELAGAFGKARLVD